MAKPYRSKEDLLHLPKKDTRWTRLKLGVVQRVDPGRMVMDINWVEGGGRADVPICTTYHGPGGFMGVIPEVGSVVVVGFFEADVISTMPIPLAFFPNANTSKRAFDLLQNYSSTMTNGVRTDPLGNYSIPKRYKNRPLAEGDAFIASKWGSEILIDRNIELTNSKLNGIVIRSYDQSIIAKSLNHIIHTDGTTVRQGMVIRNAYVTSADNNITESDQGTYEASAADTNSPDTLLDGSVNNVITKDIVGSNVKGIPFIEHRLEVLEFGDSIVGVYSDYDGYDAEGGEDTPLIPIIEQVYGTVVGNASHTVELYGQPLKPKLFSNPDAVEGNFVWAVASREGKGALQPETESVAGSYYLRVNNFHHVINKEGVHTLSYPASSASHELGAGFSGSILTGGAFKILLGKEPSRGRSLDLKTTGGAQIVLGEELNDEGRGLRDRSLNLITTKGINIQVLAADAEGNALVSNLTGNELKVISGDYNQETSGNYQTLVHGLISELTLGKKTFQTTGDYTTSIGGSESNTITGSESSTIGQGRTETIQTKGDSLKILQGDYTIELDAGSEKVTVIAGNVEQDITSGDSSISITSGNYDLSITTGNVSISTSSGSVDVDTSSGTATISGSISVVVSSDTQASVDAPMVGLGSSPTGGIITTTTHVCYLTGAPLVGSTTCTATD